MSQEMANAELGRDEAQAYGPKLRYLPAAEASIDLGSHHAAEVLWRRGGAARRGIDDTATPAHDKNEPWSVQARLSRFCEQRKRYWAGQRAAAKERRHANLQHGVREVESTSERRGGSGPKYKVSEDGCWVMETVGYAADMCYLVHRYVFNLWTFEALAESEMRPWQTMDPLPPKVAAHDGIAEGEVSVTMSLAAQGVKPPEAPPSDSEVYVVAESPGLTHNVGCGADEFEHYGDEPEADTATGCSVRANCLYVARARNNLPVTSTVASDGPC